MFSGFSTVPLSLFKRNKFRKSETKFKGLSSLCLGCEKQSWDCSSSTRGWLPDVLFLELGRPFARTIGQQAAAGEGKGAPAPASVAVPGACGPGLWEEITLWVPPNSSLIFPQEPLLLRILGCGVPLRLPHAFGWGLISRLGLVRTSLPSRLPDRDL